MAEKTKGVLECTLGPKGFAVGVEVKDGKVTKVFPSSAFLGRLFTNDVLKEINGKKVSNTAEFYKVIQDNAPGKVIIEYEREETARVEMKAIPGGRTGFDLIEMDITWVSGTSPLGILITKDADNKCIVSMIEDGSILSKQVQAGDILLKVNDTAVGSDKEAARVQIFDSMNKQKKVKLTLERPIKEKSCMSDVGLRSVTSVALAQAGVSKSEIGLAPSSPVAAMAKSPVLKSEKDKIVETPPKSVKSEIKTAQSKSLMGSTTKSETEKPVTISTYTPTTIGILAKYVPPAAMPIPASWKRPSNADPPLPQDVLDIMAANKNFFATVPTEPSMFRLLSLPNSPHVVESTLAEKAPEIETFFDPSPKPLKKTPKRVGS